MYMNQLVVVKDGQAVTDSLMVAEVFGKEHKRVLQDIRNLGCSENFRQHNFVPSNYVNSQQKTLPKFYMSNKGFTLLAMGYTGEKAMQFKEAYIEEFERMEKQLNEPKQLSEREQLAAVMKISFLQEEDIKHIKSDIETLKDDIANRITLDYGQQRALENAKKARVYHLWENGIINQNVHDTRKKVFAAIGRELKNAFAVASYKDIKQKDFDEAMNFVKAWRPRLI